MEYLETNLTKEVKDLYTENQTLMLKRKAQINEDILCSWIGRILLKRPF